MLRGLGLRAAPGSQTAKDQIVLRMAYSFDHISNVICSDSDTRSLWRDGGDIFSHATCWWLIMHLLNSAISKGGIFMLAHTNHDANDPSSLNPEASA